MIPTSHRRGEIYWLDWNPARGSEQAGRRPGIIVSNDRANQLSSVVIVAAITTKQAHRRYRFHVPVPAGDESGLRENSTILCDHLITISKERLGRRIGMLPSPLFARLNEALRVALGLT